MKATQDIEAGKHAFKYSLSTITLKRKWNGFNLKENEHNNLCAMVKAVLTQLRMYRVEEEGRSKPITYFSTSGNQDKMIN